MGIVGITFFKISIRTFSSKLIESISLLVLKLSLKYLSNGKTISECIVKHGG